MELENGIDTIRVELIQNNYEAFFTMGNPFWYIITILISSYFTYLLTRKGKKEEVVTEAKKLFLDKRIDTHTKLFEIFSNGRYVSGKSHETYYQIFSSFSDFNNWFDAFLKYAGNNKLLLCKSVYLNVNLLSNLRQLIYERISENGMNDQNLKLLGIKHRGDIEKIFLDVEQSFSDYLETGISLDYKTETLSASDFKLIEKRFNSYGIVKDLTSEKPRTFSHPWI